MGFFISCITVLCVFISIYGIDLDLRVSLLEIYFVQVTLQHFSLKLHDEERKEK